MGEIVRILIKVIGHADANITLSPRRSSHALIAISVNIHSSACKGI
jgi:hypothetical protein